MSIITPPTESQKRYSIGFYDQDGTNEKDTWNTWHLIPSSKPVILLPEPKFSSVEMLGANGKIDTSGILLNPEDPDYPNGVTFANREGNWEFYVEDYKAGYANFDALLHNVANTLHGKRKKVVLRSDPDYSYYGRLKIEEARVEEHWSTIVIWYDLEPYAVGPNNTKSM